MPSPPGWAVNLLRMVDPNLELSFDHWKPDELPPATQPFRARQLLEDAGRWVIWEKPNPRNRNQRTRIINVVDQDGNTLMLERPWLEENLSAIDIRLCDGDPLKWLGKRQRAVEQARNAAERDDAVKWRAIAENLAGWLIRESGHRPTAALGAPGSPAAPFTGHAGPMPKNPE